jgi:hypothetical protein
MDNKKINFIWVVLTRVKPCVVLLFIAGIFTILKKNVMIGNILIVSPASRVIVFIDHRSEPGKV